MECACAFDVAVDCVRLGVIVVLLRCGDVVPCCFVLLGFGLWLLIVSFISS